MQNGKGIEKKIAIICKGEGYGKTEKSALDEALRKAGIDNFNIISLTSILPFNTYIYDINLRKILYEYNVPDLYGEILNAVIAIKVAKEKASSALALSFNQYSPFIIEGKSKSSEHAFKQVEEGAKEMLEKRLSSYPFYVSKEKIEEEKKKIIIVQSSAGHNKGLYVCSVCACIFLNNKLKKIVEKYVKEHGIKHVGKTPNIKKWKNFL